MPAVTEIPGRATLAATQWPLTVSVDQLACMLNFEIADDPVYEGAELQWFDDPVHGTGMLVFLSRRADRRVDYYAQPGLVLDRAGYQLAGGTGVWTETDFDEARLSMHDDGVDAHTRFTDIDGRSVEIVVDDRDGRPRRRGGLLAPVSSGIDEPNSLLLVWLPAFDLVRATGAPPVLRFGGRDAAIGRLPGARLHRRHLVKYAAPVVAVQVNRTDRAAVRLCAGRPPAAIEVEQAGHRARLLLTPGLPDLAILADRDEATGRWHVEVDGTRLTGGTWSAGRAGDQITLGLDAQERWKPGPMPWLMRLVTTVVPVFRRWPTTYRWRAEVQPGPLPVMTARWERIGTGGAGSYRRATGSSPTARGATAAARRRAVHRPRARRGGPA